MLPVSESHDREAVARKADTGAVSEPADEGAVLAWACHPMQRKPWVAVGVTVFIGVIGVLIQSWTESRWFAAFGVAVLFMSRAKFCLPTRYRLSDRRITIKTTTQTMHRDWSMFRSLYPDKNGVLLSPFAGPSRLENFRGLYLMFDNNRDEVLAFVKARIGGATREVPAPSRPDSESAGERDV